MVQGIIAGGVAALTKFNVKGALKTIRIPAPLICIERGVCSDDVVVGIAASGRTPYVIGALVPARDRGAAANRRL